MTRYKEAGVSEEKARAAAKAVLGVEARETLATKHDLAELKLATKHDLAELKLATKHELAELKLATKHELAELKVDLIKWNVGVMVAMTGIFAAIVKLF